MSQAPLPAPLRTTWLRTTTLHRHSPQGGPYRFLAALLFFVFFFFFVSSAHALASRRSGLHGGSSAVEGPSASSSLPPEPSQELLAKMHRHNIAFNYGYPFWNFTDLDEAECRRLANETEQAADEDAACVASYHCDFESHRYPHWLVFTACTRGPAPCNTNGAPADEWRFSCFPYEEDVLLLRYVEFSNTWQRRRRRKRSGGTVRDAAPQRLAGSLPTTTAIVPPAEEGEEEDEPKGEWQLWFFQIPSECRCYV